MPHIITNNSGLVVNLSFWEKVWSVHGNFRIAAKNISDVSFDAPKTTWKELRVPGTFSPWLIKAGTYYTQRGKEFWCVTRKFRHKLMIELKDMKYKRLIVGLASETEKIKVFNDLKKHTGSK